MMPEANSLMVCPQDYYPLCPSLCMPLGLQASKQACMQHAHTYFSPKSPASGLFTLTPLAAMLDARVEQQHGGQEYDMYFGQLDSGERQEPDSTAEVYHAQRSNGSLGARQE